MKKRITAAALSLALCASLALPAAALEVEDARTLLRENYIHDLPAAALEAETLDELFSALNDPYTLYFSAEEYTDFLESVNGETLVGIGVSIQNTFHDGYELMSVLPDSPAQEAGLQAGDKLIAIDGQPLDEHTSPAALITGEAGTPVTVTLRAANGKVRDVTMERRMVQIPIVTYERAGTAGYIDCSSFGESTAPMIREAISEIGEHSAVWVMDLRTNPGGQAASATSAAGIFVGSGVITYLRNAQDKYSYYYTSAQDLTNKPLIILTSSHSASSSELFSAAIRDFGAGISVGQRTYGKGVAQHVFDESSYPELFDGDAMKLTAWRFFSPSGTSNETIGVLPTLLVSPENTATIAQLLSCYEPDRAWGYLKLELAGHTFYIKRSEAMQHPEAFAELLEALPPDAVLWQEQGFSTRWFKTTPEEVAQACALDYQPRSFSDLENAEYAREIQTLATYDLVSGDNGLFHPEQNLTRAQLCAMIATALNLPAGESAAFADVASDAWYAQAVSAIARAGFMAGTGENTFSPDAPVTHSELVCALSAAAVWMYMDTHTLNKEIVDVEEWISVYYYPEWAQTAARNLLALDLPLELDDPSQTVTRDTAAGMLCRLLEATHIIWNGKDMERL